MMQRIVFVLHIWGGSNCRAPDDPETVEINDLGFMIYP